MAVRKREFERSGDEVNGSGAAGSEWQDGFSLFLDR